MSLGYGGKMLYTRYSVGDPVVYVVDKQTTHPGPRAKNVYPTPKGDVNQYSVDKFWRVAEVLDDGRLRFPA